MSTNPQTTMKNKYDWASLWDADKRLAKNGGSLTDFIHDIQQDVLSAAIETMEDDFYISNWKDAVDRLREMKK